MQQRWLAMQANLARPHGMQRRSDAATLAGMAGDMAKNGFTHTLKHTALTSPPQWAWSTRAPAEGCC
jgi:hypothetical protein